MGHFQIQKTIFEIKYRLNLPEFFSLKNTKLEEELSLQSFSFLDILDKLYLVNLCPIFVGSLQNLSDGWKKIIM